MSRLSCFYETQLIRAFSHYHHGTRLGHEFLSFEDALVQEEKRLEGEIELIRSSLGYNSYSHRHHSYLRRGVYVDQVREWFDQFPNDQIYVVESECFFANPKRELSNVLQFLGLQVIAEPHYIHFNSEEVRSDVSNHVRKN